MASNNNIERFRQQRGWKRPELAKRMNTSAQQVERLEKGQRNLTKDWIDRAAVALGVLPTDIIGPVDDEKELGALPGEAPQPAADTDDVALQEWDIAYGMGGGSYLDLPVTGTPHTFSRQWLRNFTHAPPDKIFLARGAGDSMSPTILDADMVIIDTSEREIRVGDKIWAVVYGTTGFIKRIRPMPDGSVKLLSDNPNVPAETAYDGELSVVGRVVAVVRKT